MKITTWGITVGLLVLLLVSVGSALAGSTVSPNGTPALPDSSQEKSSLTVTADYIIGPEDVLDITVWKNADLSKTVQVRPDGRISLPLIGDVAAVGRTSDQLTQ